MNFSPGIHLAPGFLHSNYTPPIDRVATRILPLGPFYPAKEYHQDYYRKNPIRYH